MPTHRSGKKNRKIGRNKTWCERYRLAHKREKSKARKLYQHLLRFPGDMMAEQVANDLPEYLIFKRRLEAA